MYDLISKRCFCGIVFAILSAISYVVSASTCDSSGALSEFVETNYPEDLVFDVYRNDSLVGRHISTFDTSDTAVTVESEMTLEVKFLFVTVYRFLYTSSSQWCKESLMQLTAQTNRNGDISEVKVSSVPDGLTIKSVAGNVAVSNNAIPTNHWNPAVLNRKEVINTISGQLNKVSIEPCQSGNAQIEQSAAGAVCYEYSGDLTTRVWYDARGRWRGLEFKADDGSTITYRCQRCV